MNYLFYGFIGYWALSLTFFVFPYKKKNVFRHSKYQKYRQRKSILHISHRGGCRENLENTMQAFQHAYDLGTDCLEMDLCMTKDRKIVVLHDSSLVRMCGVQAHVKEFNYGQTTEILRLVQQDNRNNTCTPLYADLPKFLERVRLDFAPNDYISTSTCKTPYLPLFEDVLKKFPDVLLNIEIKTPDPEVVQIVNELILKYQRQDILRIQYFILYNYMGSQMYCTIYIIIVQKQNELLKSINPAIPRFFTVEGILKVYLLYLTEMPIPFFDVPDDSMQAPMYTDDFYQWKLQVANSTSEKIQQMLFHYFIWFLGLISKPLFNHLHKRGIFVYYWVLNNEKEYERALKAGCHGMMTDCPTVLKQYLIKNKLYGKQ